VHVADISASALSQSLLFVGKYPTEAFPPGTQYGLEVSAIRSASSDIVASMEFPDRSGESHLICRQ